MVSDEASQGGRGSEEVVLDETIHQPTRLRIMSMVVSVPESDRLAYGFIQDALQLTGGNLTTHLRKLEESGYLEIAKEFQGAKPRTWVQATISGRRAFAAYLSNLETVLGIGSARQPPSGSDADGRS